MTFSATHAAFSGFRLIGSRPGTILVWALAYLLAFALIAGLFLALAGASYLELLRDLGRNTLSPEQAMEILGPIFLAATLMAVLGALLAAVLNAAIFRAVLRPQQGGLAFLRLGGDEVRLFLVSLVMWLLTLAVIGVPLGLATLLATSAGDAAWAVWAIGIPAALAAGLFVGVRLSLAGPMTFARREFRLFESWELTSGRFWPLLGMFFIMALLVIVLSIVATIAVTPFQILAMAQFAPLASDAGPPDFERMKDILAQPGPMFIVGVIGYFAVTMISSVAQQVVLYAPLADAYAQMTRGSGDTVSEVFV